MDGADRAGVDPNVNIMDRADRFRSTFDLGFLSMNITRHRDHMRSGSQVGRIELSNGLEAQPLQDCDGT